VIWVPFKPQGANYGCHLRISTASNGVYHWMTFILFHVQGTRVRQLRRDIYVVHVTRQLEEAKEQHRHAYSKLESLLRSIVSSLALQGKAAQLPLMQLDPSSPTLALGAASGLNKANQKRRACRACKHKLHCQLSQQCRKSFVISQTPATDMVRYTAQKLLTSKQHML
jgi:hypothetical protein